MSQTQELRGLAFAVAYRMLGSVAEAEDVTQEALLRLHDASGVENPEAFLTTVTTRLAIDVLRSARVRRETYTGSWLPEPLVEDDAERRVEDEEAVSLAFLVLLERLNPDERAVLVLRESFDYEYADIAEILGISAANARQILSRARRRVADERPRFDPDPGERRALAARFLDAARNGDMEGLVAMLAPDALMVGDGGGKARSLPAPLQAPPTSPARSWRSGAWASGGARRSSRRSSTASRASAPSPPTGSSSTSWRSRSRAASSAGSTRCSIPTSSGTSARCRTWAYGRASARSEASSRSRSRIVVRSAFQRTCPDPTFRKPGWRRLDRQPEEEGDVPVRPTPPDDACHPHGAGPCQTAYCSHAQHAEHQLPPRDGSLPPRRRGSRGPPALGHPGVVS